MEKKEKKPLDAAAKKKRRRRIILIAVAVIVVLVIASGFMGGDAVMPVTTVTASKGEIAQTISTSGTVTTDNAKSYFSEVDVKIGTVNVSSGDAVKAGDVLIAYDETQLQTKTEQAQFLLKSVLTTKETV